MFRYIVFSISNGSTGANTSMSNLYDSNTNPTHDNTNHTSTFPDKEDVEDSDKDTPEEFIVPNWKALNCCLLSISSLSIKPLNDFFTRSAFSRHDGLSYQHSDIILANTIKFWK